MSKSKKKKDKKDGTKQDKDASGNENSAENVSKTKIATLTFSTESLRSQLVDQQQNYHKLKESKDKFCKEFMKKMESQQEIILFLEKTIFDLKKKCSKYEEQHKTDKELYNNLKIEKEILMEETNNKHKEMINSLNIKINACQDELKDLIEFKENKITIEQELSYYKNMLSKEKKERENREAFLERRFLSERERLKKEMLNKIRETKLRLLSMTEDQLHTTTKRTIMENEQMTIELQYQSKETQKLIKKTNAKNKNLKNLKRQINLHKNTENILAKRTYFLQKLVDQLHAQIKRMKQNEKENNSSNNSTSNSEIHPNDDKVDDENNINNKLEILIQEAEKKGFRKSELKIKKLKNKNKLLNKRLMEAQKTLDRVNQQNTNDITSIYKTNSEKILLK